MKSIMSNLKTTNRFPQLIILLIFLCITVLQITQTNAMFTVKRVPSPRKVLTVQKPSVLYVPTEVAKTQKRRLLIFLDDQEVGSIGVIGSELLSALFQQVSPIIVSSSLMGTVLEKRKSDVRSTETIMDQLCLADKYIYIDRKKEIEAKMRKRNEVVKESLNILADQNILACKAFDLDQWVIKKINNNLLLLIPHSYCNSIGVQVEKVKEDNYLENQLSHTELLLGLKVNHFQTINDTQVNISLRSYISSYISILANYFIPFLNDIFCTKWDYLKTGYAIPEWINYMSGHGMIHDSIAYLSLDNFKKLLIFWEKALKIQLLYIESCYVAGTNINQVYQDAKLENQQCCSFPIIVQGLGNVVTAGTWITGNLWTWLADRQLDLSSKKRFYAFFKAAEVEETNYKAIVPYVQDYDEVSTIAQIKLPYLEWFPVLDPLDKIASIGSILAQTRDPDKPLDINSFFKQKYLQTILLYTDNIPFELIIDQGYVYLENIIPMKTSGIMVSDSELTDIYRIRKISSSTYDLFKILELFKSIEIFGGQKLIFIDEIESKTGLVKDVLIDGDRATGMNAYYKKDGVLYKFNYGKDPVQITPDSYDEFHYNKGMMRYLIFHKRQGIKQGVTSEEIKRIKSALQSPIHKKVLESRKIKEDMQKELEEKRKARERTIIE